jgi:hypothetical protein
LKAELGAVARIAFDGGGPGPKLEAAACDGVSFLHFHRYSAQSSPRLVSWERADSPGFYDFFMEFLHKPYSRSAVMVADQTGGMSAELLATPRRIMRDAIYVVLTVGFFLLSFAYVRFCDRLR